MKANFLTKTYVTPSSEAKHLVDCIWPFANPYFSPLNAIFSFQLASPRMLRSEHSFFLRDGAVPLAWLLRSTTAELPGGKYFVASRLESMVPGALRSRFQSYGYYSSDVFGPGNPPETILFCGPINSSVMNLDELDLLLDRLKASLGEAALRKARILLYCPVRGGAFSVSDEESFAFQVFHRIFSLFGKRVEFIRWPTLEHTGSLKNCMYVEFNGGWLFADSAVRHIALSKGAGLWCEEVNEGEEGIRVALSPYHGVRLAKLASRARVTDSRQAEALKALYVGLSKYEMKANPTMLPWPTWFRQWIHAGGAVDKTDA